MLPETSEASFAHINPLLELWPVLNLFRFLGAFPIKRINGGAGIKFSWPWLLPNIIYIVAWVLYSL